MTDRLDTLLKDTAPIGDDAVRQFQLTGEEELRRAIVAEPAAPQGAPRRRTERAWRRPRRLALATAGAAIALGLALVGVSLTSGGGVQTGPDRAWAAQALRVAGAVPRLALGEPGWRIVRADDFTVRDGALTFEDGARTLVLRWLPGRDFDALLAGNAEHHPRLAGVDVHGSPAALFGADGVYSAVWRMGRYAFELRSEVVGAVAADAMPREEFAALVGSMRLVSVDAWLAAMPPSTVLPSARADAVEEMLTGLPLPPGFAAPAQKVDGGVQDRYHLAADVAGAVACGWIAQWVAARRAGDATAERAAVAALAGSRDWPVLREMNADGDYPEAVWRYADAVAGRDVALGGSDALTVEGSYVEALGCNAG